ncbi:MAG: SDR family NAD(P)-dependent oxidoreductase [Candidatus Buchananbacteria bacterium]|nr:SDR family NAD(P)-dependent oxidoreductase [Candidatus Buchananbacteria bacterium]
MDKKVLVTGGAGFIGSNIAKRLIRDGRRVLVLDNLATGHKNNIPAGADFIEGDISNYELVKNILSEVEAVYHLAASASVIIGAKNPVFDLENNVKGTIVLLNAMRDSGVKKILFPSSSTVYGQSELPYVLQENQKLNPMSPYAVGKIADEYYLRSYANMYGLEPVIFRIFNAFGPGQDLDNSDQGITGYVIGCLLQDKEFVLHGDGSQTRDYIYVDEVAEAFVRAEKTPQAVNQIMNLACGARTSLNDWMNLIEEVSNKKIEKITGNQNRLADVMHYQADNSKLQSILNFKPNIDFKNQLLKTIEWAKTELNK